MSFSSKFFQVQVFSNFTSASLRFSSFAKASASFHFNVFLGNRTFVVHTPRFTSAPLLPSLSQYSVRMLRPAIKVGVVSSQVVSNCSMCSTGATKIYVPHTFWCWHHTLWWRMRNTSCKKWMSHNPSIFCRFRAAGRVSPRIDIFRCQTYETLKKWTNQWYAEREFHMFRR